MFKIGVRKVGGGWVFDEFSNEEFNEVVDWGKEEQEEDKIVIESEFDIPVTSTEKKLENAEKYIEELKEKVNQQKQKADNLILLGQQVIRDSQEEIAKLKSKEKALIEENNNISNHIQTLKDEQQFYRNKEKELRREITELQNRIRVQSDQLFKSNPINLEPYEKKIENLTKEAKDREHKLQINQELIKNLSSKCVDFENKLRELMKAKHEAEVKYSSILPELREKQKIANILDNKKKDLEKLKTELKKVKSEKSGNLDFKDAYYDMKKRHKEVTTAWMDACESFVKDNKEELVEVLGKEVEKFESAVKDWKFVIEKEEGSKGIKKFMRRFE